MLLLNNQVCCKVVCLTEYIRKVTRPRGRPPKRSVTPFVDNCANNVKIQCSAVNPVNDMVNMVPNVTTDQHNLQTPTSVNLNINSCKFFLSLYVINITFFGV